MTPHLSIEISDRSLFHQLKSLFLCTIIFYCRISVSWGLKVFVMQATDWIVIFGTFLVKWWSHNEIQSNSKVYSSFVSFYINPVINKSCMGSVLLIRGVKVKGQDYFTKQWKYEDFKAILQWNWVTLVFST